jgi:trehalose/maltose hydrolase-like predicted phosphorylase
LNFSGQADIVLGLDFNTRYEIASGWTQTRTTGSRDSERGKNFWNEVKKDADDTGCRILAQTKTTGFQLFSSFRMLTNQTAVPQVLSHDKFIGLKFSLALNANKASRIDKVVFNHWERSNRIDENWKKAGRLSDMYADITFDAAYKQHVQFMERLWDRFGVEIEGDDETLQGLRFSCHVIKPITVKIPI